jgi:glycosyltransferase involved in cell wall biosynthesis
MRRHPKILRVESGSLSLLDSEDGSVTHLVDVQTRIPRFWRKIEERLRLDIFLGLQAKLAEDQCDIVWAGSEKVGIPLSFMGLQKPLVVIAHHMSSPLKAKFARVVGVVNKWDGVGFVSDESKEFFINYFGVHPDRLFQYESSKYLDKVSQTDLSYDGPIVGVGVAARDYGTLIAALTDLPGYETELFISSKFGDQLKDHIGGTLPQWISLRQWVSEDTLLNRYQRTRFVVVPLHKTTHSGAGINAILEASSFGKAVIATKTGGIPTFVRDGETGILVPPNDIKGWRIAMQRLWVDPNLAQKMGEAGRRYVESRFNPQEVNATISAFLDNLYIKQCSE